MAQYGFAYPSWLGCHQVDGGNAIVHFRVSTTPSDLVQVSSMSIMVRTKFGHFVAPGAYQRDES